MENIYNCVFYCDRITVRRKMLRTTYPGYQDILGVGPLKRKLFYLFQILMNKLQIKFSGCAIILHITVLKKLS